MAKRKLSDSEIISLLSDGLKQGVRFTDSKLSRERQKVLKYYQGELPAPVHGGNSRYVSTDVYDAVESMKSTLLETFSAHADILQFAPDHDDPAEIAEAQQASAVCKHVIFEQNSGIELFGGVIHDGLMSRNSMTVAYWDNRTEETEEEFEDLTEDALSILLSDDNVETVDDLEIDEETGLVSGTIKRKTDKSQVRIDLIPPEEFIVDPNIRSIAEANQFRRRVEKSKSDLIKEGYDKKLVALISKDDDNLRMDAERINRFTAVSDTFSSDNDRQESERKYVINEDYAWLDIDGSGITKFYKICWSGEVILDQECIERHGYIGFCPLPIPHSFYGSNYGTKAIPIQNAKTVLTRSILDHAVITNNPRYGVVKGALTNPRELLDNRIGGLVNVTRQDGIFPLPQAPLNPFVFQTVQMMDTNKEDATGVSRLSQGLNKDAVSNQNADAMVERLIGASMQRQKTIAREFAQQFLKPLYLEVYRLVMENADKEFIVEVAGKYVPVNPRNWTKLRRVSIDLRLGYGERDKLAGEYLQFGQMLASDPVVSAAYGYPQRRALYTAVMSMKGHKDVESILPEQPPEPQPDPMVMAQVQKLTSEAKAIDRRAERDDAVAQITAKLDQASADMDKRFKTLEFMLKDRDMDRKEAETDNRIEVAEDEMRLAQEALDKAPPENDKASAIISPNG